MDFLPNAKVDSCGCGGPPPPSSFKLHPAALWLLALAGSGIWYIVYVNLRDFARLLTYSVLGVSEGSRLGESLEFFFYDLPKVMMLLVVVIFGVGVIRSFFTPERTRSILAGRRRELPSNLLAALLGHGHPVLFLLQQCPCSWALSALECPWE